MKYKLGLKVFKPFLKNSSGKEYKFSVWVKIPLSDKIVNPFLKVDPGILKFAEFFWLNTTN